MKARLEMDLGGLELSLNERAFQRLSSEIGNIVCVPSHVMCLARVPDGARVGVKHRGRIHIAGLVGGGCSGGYANGTEEHGGEGLREHHDEREVRKT